MCYLLSVLSWNAEENTARRSLLFDINVRSRMGRKTVLRVKFFCGSWTVELSSKGTWEKSTCFLSSISINSMPVPQPRA